MAINWLSLVDPKSKALILVSGGGATSTEDLQFNGDIAESQDFSASAQVCLNASKQIQAGLAAATSMPMWAINGAQDHDSAQYRYNLQKAEASTAQGVCNTLVATGGFELAVTEYNVNEGEFENTDYTPGSCLLTNDADDAGQIEPAPANYSTVTVLGCVSTGVETERVGINRARLRLSQKALLRFWTMFIPPVVLTT